MIRFTIALALLVGIAVLPALGAPDDETPPTTIPAAEGEDDMAAPTITGRNRLGNETSPYLLQHKNNPVHWWPWGPEAFAAARAADKPIFLSIGYSTCYWCHVMERESFETEEVAAIMNEHFVCIKVDREERPDVDDIYMSATQLLNRGRGGWPMSVFLDPVSLKPFLAGTYYPPEDAHGRPGFKTVLRQVADLWDTKRDAVLEQAEQVAIRVVQQHEIDQKPAPVSQATIDQAVTLLMDAYDPVNAGFGRGPNKFPTPVYLEFLLAAAWDVPEVRKALLHTLDRMAIGGMYDQVGGGFHRYSTDPQWIVPHFEKMLYDNGQLASAYAEVYERTGDPFYAHIVRETLDYVLREMRSDEGAFWSAQDAEVNHLEGENYLWLPEQVRTTLTDAGLADDVDFTLEVFGFDRGTNFQDPHHPEAGQKNVIVLIDKPAVLAERMGMSLDAFNARVTRIKAALLAERDTRDQPGTDDKVLAGWNGLMIRGFADGGRVLDEPRYVDAARAAAQFVLEKMRAPDGGLLRTYRAGEAKIDAFLEDYAAMMLGLLALDRATGEPAWREAAADLETLARERFWDEEHGGWYDTMPGQADLFVRIKSMYDGATPTGNSAMLNALVDLYERTGDEAYLDRTRTAVTALSSHLAQRPTASAMAMRGVVRLAEIDPDTLTAAEPVQGGAVKLKVAPESVALGPGDDAWIEVVLDIEDGYHMNAHDPGLEMLIPLSVRLVGGEGLEVDPSYPDGEIYAGPVGAMRVHSGTVIVPILVRRTGDLTGREKLMLAYQVCDDKACLQPVSLVLPVTFSAK